VNIPALLPPKLLARAALALSAVTAVCAEPFPLLSQAGPLPEEGVV
jgi:hypothetical protein